VICFSPNRQIRRLWSQSVLTIPAILLCSNVFGFSFSPFAHPQNRVDTKAEDKKRGIALYEQNHFREAVEALRKATKADQHDHEAWYFLGLALIRNKDLKGASQSFETVLKLNPEFAPGHAGLAYALLLRNKPIEAMREAQAALALNKKIPDAHYIIGVVQLREGNREDALKHAEEVIRLDARFAPAYLLKSEALVGFLEDVRVGMPVESRDDRVARYREAAAALEKYLELNPDVEDKPVLTAQLDGLRFHMRVASGTESVFSGKDVTVKARVLYKPEPAYTPAARQNQITGTVILIAIFAADGNVRYIIAVRGLPFGLTEASIRAAQRIKFVPAMVNDKPVSMWMQLEYNFAIF